MSEKRTLEHRRDDERLEQARARVARLGQVLETSEAPYSQLDRLRPLSLIHL